MKTNAMKMRNSMRAIVVATLLACGGAGFWPLNPLPATAQVKGASDLSTMMTPTLPAGALEIPAAMKSAKVGDTIIVRGTIAMSQDAFAEKAATFTLVDESARIGAAPKADALPQTTEGVPASAKMTIQIQRTGGKVLDESVKGKEGLKPGAEVFVTGKVEAANGSDTLVLSATSMHVPRASLATGFFAEKEPEGAKDISEARKAGTFKVGDEVVLRGRIGGAKESFVPGRAVFTLVGRGIKACSDHTDDRCPTPWDYCCESKATINANSVTVQVVNPKGQVLRTDIKGRRSIKELSEIIVVGKVASSEEGIVVINATKVYEIH